MIVAWPSVRGFLIRLLFPLGALPLVAAGAAVAVYAYTSPNPPVLDCPQEIDLGDQAHGEQAVGRFSVANLGGAPLRLDGFATSCSCAGVEINTGDGPRRVTTVSVPPAGRVTLTVRVSAAGRIGSQQAVGVAFSSNDPARPAWLVRVIIPRVTGGVHAEPLAVVFGEVPLGARPTRVVRLFDNGIVGRRVTAVRSLNPDRFDARLVPVVEGAGPASYPAAGRQIGTIEITPITSAAGPLRGRVEVRLADGDRPPDRIDVFGEVVGPVVCRPEVLVLPRTVAGRRSYEGEFRVTLRHGRPVGVRVGPVPGGITATTRTEPDAVVVAVRCDSAVGSSGSVRVMVYGDDGAEVPADIPVVVVRGEP